MWVLSFRVPLDVVPLVIFADLNYKGGGQTMSITHFSLNHFRHQLVVFLPEIFSGGKIEFKSHVC